MRLDGYYDVLAFAPMRRVLTRVSRDEATLCANTTHLQRALRSRR